MHCVTQVNDRVDTMRFQQSVGIIGPGILFRSLGDDRIDAAKQHIWRYASGTYISEVGNFLLLRFGGAGGSLLRCRWFFNGDLAFQRFFSDLRPDRGGSLFPTCYNPVGVDRCHFFVAALPTSIGLMGRMTSIYPLLRGMCTLLYDDFVKCCKQSRQNEDYEQGG